MAGSISSALATAASEAGAAWRFDFERFHLLVGKRLRWVRRSVVFPDIEIQLKHLPQVAPCDRRDMRPVPHVHGSIGTIGTAGRVAILHSPAVASNVDGLLTRYASGPEAYAHFDASRFGWRLTRAIGRNQNQRERRNKDREQLSPGSHGRQNPSKQKTKSTTKLYPRHDGVKVVG
jgi:hypothetical protein